MAVEPMAVELLVPLRADGAQSLHRLIYDELRRAILSGRLRPGERLPSTRQVAQRLRVARNTIARAYDDLASEGYLEGRVGSGTYVPRALPAELLQPAQPPPDGAIEQAPRRGLSTWAERALAEDQPLAPMPCNLIQFRQTHHRDHRPRRLLPTLHIRIKIGATGHKHAFRPGLGDHLHRVRDLLRHAVVELRQSHHNGFTLPQRSQRSQRKGKETLCVLCDLCG